MLIKVDLKKLISRGRTINVMDNKHWIPLTFEKLPRICFGCRRIIHAKGSYKEGSGSPTNSIGQCGPWLLEAFRNKLARSQARYGFQSSNSNENSNRGGEWKEMMEQPHEMVVKNSGDQARKSNRLNS